ncbi:MAG: IPT/TIG domain-containing protein [Candidatus Kapabacteria bacterium]|nr:IPT/TIG domain-containing protein [Ignavibacteriota bacterium]MCW5884225.1 IPT/TIG domain-containing protein [Candidatus Kapabacteria bacterium]
MKRLYQFFILFLLITAIGCDDSPVKVVKNPDLEPTSDNIRFNPDTLILSDLNSNHLITFYGINFQKHTPDSILIDNTKFEFQTSDTLLFLSIMAIRAGFHDIDFYFPSGLITLEKKIYVLYGDDVPPNEKSIYFKPDTLYLDIDKPLNTIYLHGVNFEKHIIDSVLIGSSKCEIVTLNNGQLEVLTSVFITGNYPVFVIYKGQKIELLKKLRIVHPIIDFDILTFINFYRTIHKVPVLLNRDKDTERPYEFSHYIHFSNFPNGIIDNSYSIYIGSGQVKLNLAFDSKYRFIKKLYSYKYEGSYGVGPPYFSRSIELELHDIPYSVYYYENNKIELAIELYGTKINDYYPLINYRYEWWSSQKGNDRITEYTIPKKDPVIGRNINYFPASDSSAIRLYLRNY